MSLARGFPAVVSPDANVLILGSMPGRPSLAASQYYANPRNAFWRIMAELLGFELDDTAYEKRLPLLRARQIALWDVLASCYRVGSLDAAIEVNSVVANEFNAFLSQHDQVRRIFFNGAKAEELWRRHVQPEFSHDELGITFCRLPSTSPAYAAMPYAKKLEIWRKILVQR